MAKVFVAGHGRMRRSGGLAVPAGVTLFWAVPPRYNGSVGLSTALLSGAYDTWAGRTSEGEPFYEHFLCPDLAIIMAKKGEALRQGPWQPAADHYLLQPRLKHSVTLSSIILFLKRKVSGPLEIYWSCCRSPIGEPSYRTRLYEGGTTKDVEGEGRIIEDPGEGLFAPKISGKGVDVLLGGRDFRNKYTDSPVVVNAIDGGVTLRSKADGNIGLQGSWPGVKEATDKPGDKTRSADW